MNAIDLSPAQIRNRLILRARQAALAAIGRQRAWSRGRVQATRTRPPVVPRVTVTAGQVVQLAETDYRYATGALRLRILRVQLDISQWYDGEWVWLEGVEIGPDGRPGAFRPVLARVAALRPAT